MQRVRWPVLRARVLACSVAVHSPGPVADLPLVAVPVRTRVAIAGGIAGGIARARLPHQGALARALDLIQAPIRGVVAPWRVVQKESCVSSH